MRRPTAFILAPLVAGMAASAFIPASAAPTGMLLNPSAHAAQYEEAGFRFGTKGGYANRSSRKSEAFDRFGRFGNEARNYERRKPLGLISPNNEPGADQHYFSPLKP